MNIELDTQWVSEPIADFTLQYDKHTPRITSGDSRVGLYLGSGTGQAQGNLLHGRIHWDLFEDQADTMCAANFRGEIETEDGMIVEFDCLGFFRRPAVWEGKFDMGTYTHRYRIHRRRGEREA